ncbi:VWA domain-containing protein [Maricurvus nonylphenolicus]|uniref:VWA domain-containing protein n=1 Tax=Maricurvus nonylphenolicus TaxID=1008307 RepID=UPI0036F1B788
MTACSSDQPKNYQRGVYLLLDTSGTYTQELEKAQQIINYMLAHLEPGDSFAVARIDSGSFNEKDIIAKVVLDARPSASNRQKREFAATVDAFVKQVKSSAYTDISGGLLQAIEFLNETNVGQKHILIFSDLKEELPEGFVRDFDLVLDGFTVKALNVTKLRSDNQDPGEYLERVSQWQERVVSGGGSWAVVNDLDRSDALSL